MQFNVLTEPWINVLYKDGHVEKVGLRKLYEDAHLISRISDQPHREAAMHRFLSAFTTDMLHLKDEYEWYDVFDNGKFDMARFDSYINMCRSEGVTFDLFDPVHPFLVQVYDEEIDGVDALSSLYTTIDLPSGNNTLHRYQTPEELFEGFTPAEILSNIITTYAYPTASRMPGSVKRKIYTGSPYGSFGFLGGGDQPAFFVPLGGKEPDLFIAMMHGAISESDLPALNLSSLNGVPAAWRDLAPMRKYADSQRGEPITEISYVAAVFFPVRRIVLGDIVDGKIKYVWFSNGKTIEKGFKLEWRDPYIAYRCGKKKDKLAYRPVLFTTRKASWRELSAVTAQKEDSNCIAPWVLKHTPVEKAPAIERVLMVSLEPKEQKACYGALLGDEINLPSSLLDDPVRGELFAESLAVLEDIMDDGRIGKALKDAKDIKGNPIFSKHDLINAKKEYTNYMEPAYWHKARTVIFESLIPMLDRPEELTSDDIKEIKNTFSHMVNRREDIRNPQNNSIIADAMRRLKMATVFGNENENERYWAFRDSFEHAANTSLMYYRGDVEQKKKAKGGKA